ncbi:MAG TPA: hypothetical protein VIW69_16245 [Candidatus Elarobacter sp.]
MEALPIRPQGPHHPPHRTSHKAAHRPAHRGAAAGAPAHPAAAIHPAPAAHAHTATAPASPGDLAALAEQASFDAVASARAEQQREMNVLRDLAMQQVKRDDQTMNEWIKLI